MFDQTFVKQLETSLKAMEARQKAVSTWADHYDLLGYPEKANDYRREVECLTKATGHIREAIASLAGPGHRIVLDLTEAARANNPPGGSQPSPNDQGGTEGISLRG
jgi:hypothetical protein